MAPSSGQNDLRALYERAADSPVTVGDHISGKRVIGFCSNPEGDCILLEGEEDLREPPDRPLPHCGAPAGLERTGLPPVAGLPFDCLQAAPPSLPAALENAFETREDGQFVRSLLDEIVALGHHAWLAGGSVRDLLSAGSAVEVKDFDLTGTIGPGRLDAMIRLRRRHGVGDYAAWLSPQNVWSVTPQGQRGPRLVEYKPLSRPGLRLSVWGGGLKEDATTRDLTFNALYYDRQYGVLADPCGQGRGHLEARVMDTPYRGTDPVDVASIILRCMKFRLRYQEIDISRIVTWIVEKLPDDLTVGITEPGWKRLVLARRWSVLPELNGHDEVMVAGEFGPKAARLVREIMDRA
jgi:poly(A) polymerase